MVEQAQARREPEARDDAGRLLEVIGELVEETRGEPARVDVDADLEGELGFDSLSRSELVARVERAFAVDLPDEALRAETPQALLETVLAASGREGRAALPRHDAPAAVDGEPEAAETLPEVLAWHVERHGDRTHIRVQEDGGGEHELSYADLDRGARAVAASLLERGLEPEQCVALMLPTGRDYFFAFFGVLLAGGVPVPIYPPARPSQIEEHLRRHAGILANARAFALVTVAEARTLARMLEGRVESLRHVLTAEQLAGSDPAGDLPEIEPDTTAFVQYTSGTTGDPKGVVLSHANLLANIRAMGRRVEAASTDVFVSWLPLYHDMGLIGAWLGSLYYACPLAVMSPLRFLARPRRWLEAIHRHRGTLSAAPNFGYALCLRHVGEDDLEGLDLSTWRFAFNGAEPVSPDVLERFAERFAGAGFAREALSPVYGLAEACVGLTLSPPGRGPVVDAVDRERFMGRGEAAPIRSEDAADAEAVLRFAGCGRVLDGHEIRVIDDAGETLPERREGTLEFRGPSATRGYLRNEGATAGLFDDGWLDTGDRGYLADGELFVTGRVKDVIIRGGRNIYPQELEEAVGAIEGIRQGCVAAFGVEDPDADGERLVVVAEYRDAGADREALHAAVRDAVAICAMLPPDDVALVPPHRVLKTSSGKVRRAATAERYRAGELGRAGWTAWWRWVTLAASGARAAVRDLPGGYRGLLFAGYAWTVFALLAPVLWAGALVLPGARARWRWLRRGMRLALRLTGTRLDVRGADRLPADACVVVANHASYLDGLVLTAALERDLRYVAKHELAGQLFAGVLLARMEVLFVERARPEAGAEEASAAERAAREEGSALAFFPEGTFQRRPGLLPFRMGAFVTAARAGAPVVPVAIRGTRRMLPSGSWLPRRAALAVRVGRPVAPEGDNWEAAVALRKAARRAILDELDEPDLA